MTITRTIDQICEWLNTNVCPNVELKRPPEDGKATNKKYEYELAHPYAFPLYLPSKDKLPPTVKTTFPAICVQLEYGNDLEHNREMNINLSFGSWNPGIHPNDWLYPYGDKPEEGDFTNEVEGWRDLWNFIDYTVTAIESTGYLGEDVEIVKNEPLEFGPYKEQDEIVSYYPWWFGYCRFKVRSMILRNDPEVESLL